MLNIPEETIHTICEKYTKKNGIYTVKYVSSSAVELRDKNKINVLHLYEFIFERKYMVYEILFSHKNHFLEELALSKNKGDYLENAVKMIA